MPKVRGVDVTKRPQEFLDVETKFIIALSKKKDIKVFPYTKTVIWNRSPNNSYDVGNKTLGKLDFLKKKMGYTILMAYDDSDLKRYVNEAMKN